jgi:hypothetical protein
MGDAQMKYDDDVWGSRYDLDSELDEAKEDNARLRRCIHMAMGCISPLSKNPDERLAWYRLEDAVNGREPRASLTTTS